jgi:hypothetical protein
VAGHKPRAGSAGLLMAAALLHPISPSGFQDLHLNLADQQRLRAERRTWHVFGMSERSGWLTT